MPATAARGNRCLPAAPAASVEDHLRTHHARDGGQSNEPRAGKVRPRTSRRPSLRNQQLDGSSTAKVFAMPVQSELYPCQLSGEHTRACFSPQRSFARRANRGFLTSDARGCGGRTYTSQPHRPTRPTHRALLQSPSARSFPRQSTWSPDHAIAPERRPIPSLAH
ncbi:hypothetical protein PHLGIDRAFT_480879 [Phlebiopsis gigantea 11061_1 CR5-6]|uniref:Uncharacterized protein n=1 Tax=Phlebiopsis gigantea (strain 11061_1 CR5-6) TaxID=745531 RepID=A0A0C3S609_PHLG1|nr:hypothetical protein PHLGIDRAFT_480879 [Phlebiopsis gigantea 11061_1 CR5-6]